VRIPDLLFLGRVACSPGITGQYRYFLIVLEDTISLYPTVPKKDGNNNGDVHPLSEGRL
jgi:hypothetical protein